MTWDGLRGCNDILCCETDIFFFLFKTGAPSLITAPLAAIWYLRLFTTTNVLSPLCSLWSRVSCERPTFKHVMVIGHWYCVCDVLGECVPNVPIGFLLPWQRVFLAFSSLEFLTLFLLEKQGELPHPLSTECLRSDPSIQDVMVLVCPPTKGRGCSCRLALALWG